MTQRRMRSADEIRVADISLVIRQELAKHLDGGLSANWRILAEELGFVPLDAEWIGRRTYYVDHSSPTLLLFEELCGRDIKLGQFIRALRQMNHMACISVLKAEYGDELVRSALEVEVNASQLLKADQTNAYNGGCQNSPTISGAVVLPNPNDDIWTKVHQIGNSFNMIDGRKIGILDQTQLPVSVDCDATDLSMNNQVNGGEAAVGYAPRRVLSSGHAAFATDGIVPKDESRRTFGNFEHQTFDMQQHDIGSAAWSQANDPKHSLTQEWVEKLPPANEGIARNDYRQHQPVAPNGLPLNCSPFEFESNRRTDATVDNSPRNLKAAGPGAVLSDALMRSPGKRNTRVFLTYTNDSKKHRSNIVHLCDCLTKNHFSVSLDVPEKTAETEAWHNARYDTADYIIVLISPVYRRVVDSQVIDPADQQNSSCNAVRIYQRMQSEHAERQGKSHRSRFVAVVMPGSSKADVPAWLRGVSPVYAWPDDYKSLFYWMIDPRSVIADLVHNRERELNASCGGRKSYVGLGGLAHRVFKRFAKK